MAFSVIAAVPLGFSLYLSVACTSIAREVVPLAFFCAGSITARARPKLDLPPLLSPPLLSCPRLPLSHPDPPPLDLLLPPPDLSEGEL
jgi:hypothetical protein